MSRHPDEPMTCCIRPPDMTEAEVKTLVTTIPPREETITGQEAKEEVCQLIQDFCNQRSTEQSTVFPF
jgi:hypothetical protein